MSKFWVMAAVPTMGLLYDEGRGLLREATAQEQKFYMLPHLKSCL